VLSRRGLRDGLVTRPEESYRLWCVWVWSWNLHNVQPTGAVEPSTLTHSTASSPISWRRILILVFHLCQVLPLFMIYLCIIYILYPIICPGHVNLIQCIHTTFVEEWN
jgi:hypothetical protein